MKSITTKLANLLAGRSPQNLSTAASAAATTQRVPAWTMVTMTYDREWHERQHQAIMAVSRALTEAEREQIETTVGEWWPNMKGALTADALDILSDRDMFLVTTEPFYEEHGHELPDGMMITYAVYAIILLQQELTVPAVLELLAKAAEA
jgi:hypothetical protein